MARGGRRWLFRIVGILVLLAGGFASFLWWAAGGRQQPGERDDEIRDYGAAVATAIAPTPTSTPASTPTSASASAPTSVPARPLRVLTWNIAYARGTNPDNDANEVPSKAEAERRLKAMGEPLRQQHVDVVLLQEVDFASRRSRYLDQLASLARNAGLRYSARALSWKARWVPHPLWPPHKQYGRMLGGGGVLSRYPIERNRVLLHPKPPENGAIYNAFYLYRYSQFVTLRLPDGQRLLVVNNHLEAFKKANRVHQAQLLSKRLAQLPTPRPLMLLGGDLNTTPQEARRKHGFSDSPEDDYRDDATLATLGARRACARSCPRRATWPTRRRTSPSRRSRRRVASTTSFTMSGCASSATRSCARGPFPTTVRSWPSSSCRRRRRR